MTGTASEDRRPWPSRAIVLLVLLALAILVGAGFWEFSYDDAFITYRYARNWAEGLGLVYNPGETVLGTTAPGYSMALGLLTRLTRISIPGWGTLLSLLAIAVAAAMLGAALRSGLARQPVLWAALPGLAAGTAMVLQWNIELLGTETLPVMAFVVAAAYLALERDRPIAAGLLAAAAMAFRLDAALAAGAIGVVLWATRRRFPVRYALAGLAPLGAWLVWLYARFGTVLPNTLAGKRSEFAFALQNYSIAEWLWLRRTLPLSGALALLALAAVGLAVGWRREIWRRPIIAGIALWLSLHEVVYRLLDVPFAPWYHVSLVFALVWLASLGALGGGSWLVYRISPSRQWLVPLFAVLLLVPILAPSVRYVLRQWGEPPDPRYQLYAAVGRYLGQQVPRDGSVAAVEIGVLGWTSRRPILDLSGLVSPSVLVAKSTGALPELVAAERPSYLVDVPWFHATVLGPVLRHPAVAPAYRAVATFAAPEYGATVRLLRRQAIEAIER